ncbi:MAG TPA: 2'-5' RNA ligase family protein [Thermoflexales bacterium]|nr:2'-5' RNA ligase family protein [Thermoflexales bacterium]
MNGVVSLLDPAATAQIHALWAEMQAAHGIDAVARRVPWPHVSYHIAPRYDPITLEAGLRALARETGPLDIQATGLGIFTGPTPVLYLAVTRSPALSALHARAWAACNAAAEDPSPLYAPNVWVPHITLAHHDVTPANLPRLIADLGGRDFAWTIRLSAFTALFKTDDVYQPAFQAPFGAA